MGARLFTAVLPPNDVVEALDGLLDSRRGAADPMWRWTRPEGWHVTTAFMTDVGPTAQDRLIDALTVLSQRHTSFDLTLQGARCFPSPERTRLLALDVAAGSGPLGELAAGCRRAASVAGAEPEGERFVGHLSLARVRRAADATTWVHVLDSFPSWSWRVKEFVLIESHLADGGNRHEIVERFELSGKEPS